MSGLPPRLKIRGQQILYPDGTPALLRGMNIMFELDSEYAVPRADTDDLLFELLPGTNLLRLVMLRWDDRPTRTKSGDGNDCSAGNLYSGRSIQPRCIEQFKDILRWCGPMAHAQYPMPQQPGLPPTTGPKHRRARKTGASVRGYGRSSRHGLVWRREKWSTATRRTRTCLRTPRSEGRQAGCKNRSAEPSPLLQISSKPEPA